MTSDEAPGPQLVPSRPRFALLRAVCFTYVSFFWTLFVFILTVLAWPLAPRSGGATHRAGCLWARGYLFTFGAGVRVEHAERLDPKTSRLLVANHASWLDPPAVMLAFPGQARFFLKRELLKLPFVGWYAAIAGNFLLDRSNPREGKRLLESAVERCRRFNLSPVMFPEGTRTHDGKLAPLKAGSFQVALMGGMDVQPMAVLGTYEMLPRGARFPSRGGDIVVRVGEPISTAGLSGSAGRRTLAERVTRALHDLGVQ